MGSANARPQGIRLMGTQHWAGLARRPSIPTGQGQIALLGQLKAAKGRVAALLKRKKTEAGDALRNKVMQYRAVPSG
ncbi:hypothetical protein HWV62_3322 [Athelia sp. TMB]|nr:hypothetical protein HWV62_3322 [Athelia sp. TMB]